MTQKRTALYRRAPSVKSAVKNPVCRNARLDLEPVMALADIRIVLVHTTHPGNIGAAARAMKNMGLASLWLVAPRCFPDPEATARATGAVDILDGARVAPTLDDAIAGCHLVIGTSARARRIEWPALDPRGCAQKLAAGAASGSVALLFGQERTGLTNDELDRCHYLVTVPTSPDYPSLNLAAAVQILAYEILLAAQSAQSDARTHEASPGTSEDMHHLYRHLEQVLVEVQFLDPDNPRLLMRRLRRLFNRANLNRNEINILRGILTAIQQSRRDA